MQNPFLERAKQATTRAWSPRAFAAGGAQAFMPPYFPLCILRSGSMAYEV